MERPKLPLRGVFIPLMLVAATLAAFWPVWRNQFIRYDDLQYIVENPHVLTGLSWANLQWALGSTYAANWHPLTWISHMVDVELFGLRPGWHHFTSLVLHTANAMLLFVFLRRATGAEWRSGMVAALFALHPLHVESVAWAAERKDVLSTFFFMLGLLAYARFVQTKAAAGTERASWPRYYFVSIGLYALGLMSKPMLVTLPFLLILLDFWPFQRLTLRALNKNRLLSILAEKLPFLILSLGSCVVTFLAQEQSSAIAKGFPLSTRLLNAAASYLKYAVKTVWPVDLTIIYPHPALCGEPLGVTALLGALLVISAAISALLLLRRAPWFAVGWFWFVGTLVPVIGLVQAGNQGLADRYTYIPLIGVFLCIAWGLNELVGAHQARRWATAAAGAAVLIACSAATHRQVQYWRTNFTLFSRALEVTEKNALAHLNVGADLGERGEFGQAEQHFQAALMADPRCVDAYYYLALTRELTGKAAEAVPLYEEALRLHPTHDLARSHLGAALVKLGQTQEGMHHLAESARLNPSSYYARREFGRALAERGDLAGAARELNAAANFKPNDEKILSLLAEVEFKRGNLREAERVFAKLVQLSPTNAEHRLNLAGTCWKLGDQEQAFTQYAEAIRLEPKNPNVRFSAGAALALQGRQTEAAAQFSEATTLNPDFLDAWIELGRALVAQGAFDQARAAFESAVRLCPTNANLHLNLGNALMLSGRTNEAANVFARALELRPDLPDKFLLEGESLAQQRQWTAALARCRTVLWLQPANPEAQRQLAWLLATHPQANARNGAEALRLAQSALAAARDKSARFWAALDAAYAETGDFARAIETAEKTCELATSENQAALAEAARSRLALYRQQKPFHQP